MTYSQSNKEQEWLYKDYMRAKHEILRRYMYTWLNILKNKFPRIHYIDGFAGKGKYDDNSEGSPLIVLEAAIGLYKNKPKSVFEIYFIEKEKNNIEVLQNEVQKLNVLENVIVNCINDDFGNFFEEYMKDYENEKRNIPKLFFLDPFGYSQIKMNQLSRILQMTSCEYLIIFMYRDLNRFIEVNVSGEKKEELFGEKGFCDDLPQEHPYRRERTIIENYRQCLIKYSRATYLSFFKVKESEKSSSKTKYCLIHGTNHFKGYEVMRENMMKVGGPTLTLYGSKKKSILLSYLQVPYNDIVKILRENKIVKEKVYLLQEIKEIIYLNSFYLEKDIRSVLKKMESEQKVQIIRIVSKKTGIKDGDKVKFTENFFSED